jgi:hypothetical protein
MILRKKCFPLETEIQQFGSKWNPFLFLKLVKLGKDYKITVQ